VDQTELVPDYFSTFSQGSLNPVGALDPYPQVFRPGRCRFASIAGLPDMLEQGVFVVTQVHSTSTARGFMACVDLIRVALQKVGQQLVKGGGVLDHDPVPALPEDVHLHVGQAF
jgi:hypothetical protein